MQLNLSLCSASLPPPYLACFPRYSVLMAISYSQKARYSVFITAFFSLFLFSLFYFSKRALEPSSLSIYAHFLPHPLTISSSTKSITQHLSPSSTTTPPSLTLKPHHEAQNLSQPPSKHPQSESPSPSHTKSQSLLPNATPPTAAVAAAFVKEERLPPPKNLELGEKEKEKQCDLYTGHWVRDEGYPLYQPGSCPYVDEAFSCQPNGRPDSGYLKWRWKPSGCHLPSAPSLLA
ncbi:hypothetical protein ACLOJK_036886 [Asimina triloba]